MFRKLSLAIALSLITGCTPAPGPGTEATPEVSPETTVEATTEAIAPSPSLSPSTASDVPGNAFGRELAYLRDVRAQMPLDAYPFTDTVLIKNGYYFCDLADAPKTLSAAVAVNKDDRAWFVQILGAYTFLCPEKEEAYKQALRDAGIEFDEPSDQY